ncbi:Pex12 amino terminal region-domain-containing protein [Microdochium trichocladiopsis]|uniref:Pex12 amino terminal region-domain-containing protein n=1 Tax=Microdochium trichocladiopsis TaxID=1682393 RepID=A0A9P9BRU5_9PEZI|nr:Pex12 amino terminal region-domain-containing protein [Microdochium trichocladiopsis]KAH7027640.1 Pex12 amino terminal region-domain-containing protein [Microdochium trichocladiopsis]
MSSSNFAQAQQRLAARRLAREQQAQAHIAAQRDASRAWSQVTRLPYPFNRLGSTSLAAWELISSREGTRPAFRVGQVDAELLDEDLLGQLSDQVGEAVKYLGSNIKDDWSAEILLALRAVLFKLSVWDNDATYGAALQNLKYTDARHDGPVLVAPSRWQKAIYGLVTVGGKYTWTKWEDWLRDQHDGYDEPSPRVRMLEAITARISSVHSTAAFVSFLIFLMHGRYRTILDRVLRMRLAPPTSQVNREVSFEYLNRQLVWHAFTEFLLFVLPLVGINRWRRWLSRTWRKTKEIISTAKTTTREGEDGAPEKQGELAFLPERTCAICYQDQNSAVSEADMLAAAAASGSGVVGSAQTDITNPYEAMPCGCIYCFVCLATRLEREEGEGWTCLRCGELVKECKPWSGDVLEESPKSALRRASSSWPPSGAVAGQQVEKHVGFTGIPDDATSEEAGSAGAAVEDSTVYYNDEVAEDEQPEVTPIEGSDYTDTESEAYEEDEDGVEDGFSD